MHSPNFMCGIPSVKVSIPAIEAARLLLNLSREKALGFLIGVTMLSFSGVFFGSVDITYIPKLARLTGRL